MHAIHTTPGFIIDSRPHGEAGKLLSLFTRDYGLVFASAQGIRLEKSKLRYHTQEYSFGTFSLVRGKEYWRLTSAKESQDLGFKMYDLRIGRELIARLALLLRRLLHGEEPHPELFGIIESCAKFLSENDAILLEQSKTLESLIVLRMLHALGYVRKDSDIGEAFESAKIDVQLLDLLAPKRTALNQHINKALRESHL